MMPANLLMTEEPHYIPGYTGHCPQYIFHAGQTYGSLTHKLITNTDHYKKNEKSKCNKDSKIEENMLNLNDYASVIGYEGFIPKMKDKIGDRYSLASAKGIIDFGKEVKKLRHNLNQLQCSSTGPPPLNEKEYKI